MVIRDVVVFSSIVFIILGATLEIGAKVVVCSVGFEVELVADSVLE